MIKDKLPDKPSELIRLALKDLELVEQDPKYTVNMYSWYAVRNNQCAVCLAGCVLAKTINVDKHLNKVRNIGNDLCKVYTPNSFNRYISRRDKQKLYLLDTFRGTILKSNKFISLVELGFFNIETLIRLINCDFGCFRYETNTKMFKRRLLRIAEILEQEGF